MVEVDLKSYLRDLDDIQELSDEVERKKSELQYMKETFIEEMEVMEMEGLLDESDMNILRENLYEKEDWYKLEKQLRRIFRRIE